MKTAVFLFLRQNPDTADWRVVVLFAEHSLEPSRTDLHQEWLSSDRGLRSFIEDLPPVAELPLEVAPIKLITTVDRAKRGRCITTQKQLKLPTGGA